MVFAFCFVVTAVSVGIRLVIAFVFFLCLKVLLVLVNRVLLDVIDVFDDTVITLAVYTTCQKLRRKIFLKAALRIILFCIADDGFSSFSSKTYKRI